MSATRRSRGIAVLQAMVAGLMLALPAPSPAQVASVASLEGEWIRVDSTYAPNDTMRIGIVKGEATLLTVPKSVASNFVVGRRLWMEIRPDGSVQVLGSDGSYHPGVLTLEGTDVLRLSVKRQAAGDAQVWRRAGPAIDGAWVRAAVGNQPGDRMRIEVRPGEAAIRFLPANAARHLRVGTRYWREIRAATLEVLGDDGGYQSGEYRADLERQQLCVWTAGRSVELWVRPGSEQAALSGLATGPDAAQPCLER